MTALRSGGRRDLRLLVAVWLLTAAVLAVGIVLVAPILIFWGAVGLVGAGFLTRVHRRTPDREAHDEEKVP